MTPSLPDATETLRGFALACLWFCAARRFWRMKRSPRDRTVFLAVTALACAMTVVWTPLGVWLVDVTGVAFLDDLLKRCLGIVAFAGAFGFVADVTGTKKTGLHTARWLVALVAIGTMVVTFAFAPRPAVATAPDLVLAVPGDPFVVVYGSTFFAYLAVTMVAMLVLFTVFGLQAQERLIRIGSFLEAAGCAVALVYALMRTSATVRARTGTGLERLLSDERVLDVVLCVSFVLIISGILIPASARIAVRFRELRALDPLWRACCAAHPEVALRTGHRWFGDLLAARDGAGTRRYRRVIEIRDGQRHARGYVSAATVAEARRRLAARGLSGTDLDAAVVACELTLAWRARAADEPRVYSRDGGTDPGEPDSHSLDGEVRWLSQVSGELVGPAVSEVARELGGAVRPGASVRF